MLLFQQLSCSLRIYIGPYPDPNKVIDKPGENLCNFKAIFPFNINYPRVSEFISCNSTSVQKLFSLGIHTERVNAVIQAIFFSEPFDGAEFTHIVNKKFQGYPEQCTRCSGRDINNFLSLFKELLGLWRHFFLRRNAFGSRPNYFAVMPKGRSVAFKALRYANKVEFVAPRYVFQFNFLVVVWKLASYIARYINRFKFALNNGMNLTNSFGPTVRTNI